MDAAAGRGGSLPVASSSSQPPRKEWRAASDHSFRNGKEVSVVFFLDFGWLGLGFCRVNAGCVLGFQDSEHVKLGQPDERTIFEVCGY